MRHFGGEPCEGCGVEPGDVHDRSCPEVWAAKVDKAFENWKDDRLHPQEDQ